MYAVCVYAQVYTVATMRIVRVAVAVVGAFVDRRNTVGYVGFAR